MRAVLRNLVDDIVQNVDAIRPEDKPGFAQMQAKRALAIVRFFGRSRIIGSYSDRLLGIADRVIDFSMSTRAYTSAEQLAIVSTTKFKAASSAVGETRAQTRARYNRLRSSIARLPQDLQSSLRVYYVTKTEGLRTLSHESRASLKARVERCNMLLNEKVRTSRTLTFLSSKVRALLVLARVLPNEDSKAKAVAMDENFEFRKKETKKVQRSAPPGLPSATLTPSNVTHVSSVTPTTMISTEGLDACISPGILDSMHCDGTITTCSTETVTSNPTATSNELAAAHDFANPTHVCVCVECLRGLKDVDDAPMSFNAEGNGGLWIPTPSLTKSMNIALASPKKTKKAPASGQLVPLRKEVKVLKANIEENINLDQAATSAKLATGKREQAGAKHARKKKQNLPFAPHNSQVPVSIRQSSLAK